VTDTDAGRPIIEKKFYKAEFGELLANPEYKPYLDALIESVLIRTGNEPPDDMQDAEGAAEE